MYASNGLNGPYSMPPPGMMSDQYVSNSLPGPMQQTVNVHDMSQPAPHHFVPIATVPGPPESFHPPAVMTNANVGPPTFNPRYLYSTVECAYRVKSARSTFRKCLQFRS